jgi:quinoprotein glucose dehydrogenase
MRPASRTLARAARRGLLALAVLTACRGPDAHAPEGRKAARAAVPTAPADAYRVAPGWVLDTVASGLAVPWAIAAAPDGGLVVTERGGRVVAIAPGARTRRTLIELPVYADDPAVLPESGLMGLALAPDFATSGRLFVHATVRRPGLRGSAGIAGRLLRRALRTLDLTGASPFVNRVYVVERGRARVLVDDLPASFYHAGGALALGPDGLLYVGTGDTQRPDEAQRDGALAGRILRYAMDGGTPAGHPVAESADFARGLRNPQALAWLGDGTIVALDHGPSSMSQEAGRSGHDELNVIVPGGNYGWPVEMGVPATPRHLPPVHLWTQSIAPAGLAVDTSGALLVASLKGRALLRLTVARVPGASGASGVRITREDTLLGAVHTRFRAVAVGRDGAIFVGTSNRDGRGTITPDDDLILRLRARRD